MTGLALAILIAVGVASLWDLLEPNAVEIKVNSGARLVFGLTVSVAGVVLALLVLHAAAIAFVLVFVALFAAACFKAALS